MIYKMTLKDSTDEMTFNLLEVPIVDKDIEGAVDNVTLDGNQYTDYLYLKKQYIQKWSIMCDEEYERLRGFYTRQFDEAEIPTYELYYGETIYNDYTLSGDYILADVQGVEPARMSLAQLDGNATQQTYSGKNLWNGAEPLAVTGYGTYELAEPLPAGTYTLSASSITTTGTGSYSLVMFLDSANQTVASDSVFYSIKNKSFTLPSEAKRVRIYSQGGYQQSQGVTTTFTGIQIESGTSVSDYEPYVGGTPAPNPDYPMPISVVTGNNTVKIDASDDSQEFPIDLGSIELAKIGTYQDRIYKEVEKWYIEKQVGKVVLDGTEDGWGRSGVATANNYYCTSVTDAANVSVNNKGAISPTLQSLSISQMFATTSEYGVALYNTAPSQIRLCFPIDELSTLAQVTTWLSTHPTTVYYALATPTTTEITNQTLIDQLEALINVSIATGIHNIFTEVASGNLNPTIVLNFIEVVSRRVELVPETPVRLTLTDGGIINACGCRKDVQLTMRETIE